MSRAIINVAVGHWYPRGQDRLKKSLETVGFTGSFIGWRDCVPAGCPPHSVIPDAFKSYAFQEAIRRGHTSVLWLDASVWAVKPVDPLFEIIEREGHLFFNGGGCLGEWCKDSALPTLRLTREQAMGIQSPYCLVMGIDYSRTISRGWLDEFCRICQDGMTLPGPHPRAKPGEISNDPRVRGHAHEQTVASALIHHYGMTLREHDVLQVLRGQPIKEITILCAAGM